jgi:DNA-binding transcriptional MocR family regulator
MTSHQLKSLNEFDKRTNVSYSSVRCKRGSVSHISPHHQAYGYAQPQSCEALRQMCRTVLRLSGAVRCDPDNVTVRRHLRYALNPRKGSARHTL